MLSRLRGKSPIVTREILQLWGRYAWYDSTLAGTDLGWKPRPLRDTLRDTLNWVEERSALTSGKS